MAIKKEVFKPYLEILEYYKNKSVSKHEMEICNKVHLQCEMDYQSLFQFGEGERLITLKIFPSWADSIIYQIYENQRKEIWLYWKKEKVCYEIYQEIDHMSLLEFQNYPDIQSEINKKLLPEKKILSETQAQVVRNLCHQKLKEDVEKIFGYDGTDYSMRIYGSSPMDYEGWTHMVKEWKLFAELTEIVADVSELERKRFYIAYAD